MPFSSHHVKAGLASEAQASLVRQHLQQVLSSPAFSGSKRCQEFLQFIVSRALAGDYDGLHERTIGAAVFERPIDYETATDAIVRVKANEVRKRLAQYYLEAGSKPPVRIELLAGSYVPEFRWLEEVIKPASPMAALPVRAWPGDFAKVQALGSKHRWLVVVAACLVTGAAAATLTLRWLSPALEPKGVWGPVFQTSTPVLVCLGQTEGFYLSNRLKQSIASNPASVSIQPDDLISMGEETVSEGSLLAALSVTRLLERHGKATQFRWASGMPFEGLRDQTAVFIGAFNNPWALEMSRGLRYTFLREQRDGRPVWMVRDSVVPDRKWVLYELYPRPMTHDFAIITRLLDRTRNRVFIFAAGITHYGTQVAGDFLTDPVAWQELVPQAPGDWEMKNLQVILETAIVGRRPTQPKVLATHFW